MQGHALEPQGGEDLHGVKEGGGGGGGDREENEEEKRESEERGGGRSHCSLPKEL